MRPLIELGRVNILMQASFLSQHLCSPREGHIDAVYRIFGYLQKNMGRNSGRMTHDPMYEKKNENMFKVAGRYLKKWKYFTLTLRK